MKYNYEIVRPLLYKSRNKKPIDAANDIINKNIFALPPFGRVKVDIKNGFKNDINSRRIWRLIHGHTFLGDFYDAYIKTNDKKYIYYAEKIVILWFEYIDDNKDDKMIFHDETTALRLMYWLNLNYIGRALLSDNFKKRLDLEIEKTIDLLSTDEFHSTNTNHGMFQDISLLTYAILYNQNPLQSEIYKFSLKRLKDYFLSTYTKDGVHKEHSPDYHYMVTSNVKKIVEVIKNVNGSKLNENEQELVKIYKNAENYAMHILQPNLYFPKIADCSPLLLSNNATYFNLFESETFNYVKSLGDVGVEPYQKQILFKDAGYFISRSGWDENSIYFLFLASYNARYHKHSDDLSFVLYKNEDLFVDSGPNGYDYDSKFTKYAYSGFAHSSLIVNNTSLPRNDDKFDKVGVLKSNFEENSSTFEITGFNYRHINTNHFRTVYGNHNEETYVLKDEIISDDRNEYKLLYQLSNKVYPIINGQTISIYDIKSGIKKAEIDLKICSNIKYFDIQVVKGNDGRHSSYEFLKMGEPTEASTIIITFYNENKKVEVTSNIRLKNFLIKDTIVKNETSYSVSNVKYSLYESKNDTKRLLVVFSAIMPIYEYKFNYYNTLKDIDSYQLYIKDDVGEFGNYYIGMDKNKMYEVDIISLILNTISKYSIPFENVTLIGSSKGGFASLYFGLKFGFKNVISGAPQTNIGNFVIDEAPHKDVARKLSGGSDIGDKLFLNGLITSIEISKRDYSDYYICVGDKDHHLKGHIMPLFDYLKNKRIQLSYDLIPNSNHADLKSFFKNYIYEALNHIYGLELKYNEDYKIKETNLKINQYDFSKISQKETLLSITPSNKEFNIVYYLLNNKNEVIFKSKPTKENKLVFKNKDILNNRIKVFLRNGKQTIRYITPVIRNIETIVLKQTV